MSRVFGAGDLARFGEKSEAFMIYRKTRRA
jgi:hypothetical protein